VSLQEPTESLYVPLAWSLRLGRIRLFEEIADLQDKFVETSFLLLDVFDKGNCEACFSNRQHVPIRGTLQRLTPFAASKNEAIHTTGTN
jgi:hypothetical protein